MSKLIKWLWKSNPKNPPPSVPSNSESESEDERPPPPDSQLAESLKIVEEISQKREEEEEKEGGKEDEEEEEEEEEKEEEKKVGKSSSLSELMRDYVGYNSCGGEEIMEKARNFCFLTNDEDIRDGTGHKWGGKICPDKNIVKKSRSIGKEIILEIGKKILSGKFNLTKITFPIKAMVPKSVLENVVHATCVFPYYMNIAASTSDKLERMKFVISSTLSSYFWTAAFLKPLNPILGETLQASYNDGTLVLAEQISHHPPISSYLVYGPKNNYRFGGYYCYEAKGGLNSVTMINKGKRHVKFNDGQIIEYNFPEEYYSGTLMGTLKQESLGLIVFEDKANKISCELKIGKVKKKPTDYFEGWIRKDNKNICEVKGTYMGYINFDNIRYWDYRFLIPYKINMEPLSKTLPSDHLKRLDLVYLKKGDVNTAQQEKENLENLQRKDAKLRKDYQERRFK